MKTFKLLSAFVFVLALATGFSYGQCCKSKSSASACQKTSVKAASAEAPSTLKAVKVAATSETPAAATKAACCSKSQATSCGGAKASAKLSKAGPVEEMVKPVKAIAVGNKEQ